MASLLMNDRERKRPSVYIIIPSLLMMTNSVGLKLFIVVNICGYSKLLISKYEQGIHDINFYIAAFLAVFIDGGMSTVEQNMILSSVTYSSSITRF
jgi:hypothetical protein